MPGADAFDEAILRAYALTEQGRVAEALQLLTQLAARHGGNAEVWFALGRAHGILNQDAEAETAFRKAAQLQPGSRDAHLNVALSLVYQGKMRESIPSFLAARRIDPLHRSVDDTLMWALLSVLQDEPSTLSSPPPQLAPLQAQPLVSVVVPTRNRPAMLKDALESVARQGYRHWEAVVVNDGGQDVADAIRSLPPDAAPRVTMLASQSSRGTASARNMALRAARGSIIAFLDDDDVYLPGHLDALVCGMLASGAPFTYTQSAAVEERIVGGRRVEGRRGELREYRYSRAVLQVRNVIPTACWGIRRECFDLYGGFDESLPCAEDWDLLLRYSEKVPFHRVPEVTAEIRVRTDVADSVTQRTPLRPTCELFYRRHPSRGHELIELGREIYLASVA